MENEKRIVFYDGDCGFCNSSVQFILKKRKVDFYFSPLQNALAEEKLAEFNITINLDTIYYLKNGKCYNRSSAALQIAKDLKGAYPLLFGFYIFPKFLRDPLYNLVAKYRHKLKAGNCVLLTADEKHFFLDAS